MFRTGICICTPRTWADNRLRFMIIKKPSGWGTALDACRICGAEGYRQDGQNVICRHCGSAIYVPTVGEAGGCNPIGVPVARGWSGFGFGYWQLGVRRRKRFRSNVERCARVIAWFVACGYFRQILCDEFLQDSFLIHRASVEVPGRARHAVPLLCFYDLLPTLLRAVRDASF